MIKVCKQCGKEFKADGNKRLYCSRGCQWASLKKQRPTAICGYCGKEFTIKRVDVPGKYCSHQCQIDSLHDERLQRLEVKRIQREKIERERAEQLRIKMAQEEARRMIHCSECGKIFRSTQNSKYCSDRCRRRADNRMKDNRLKRCKIKDNSITLIGVYHKYGGVCQGCGQLLTFDHDPNDDRYPSIDHIVPISKGGNHTWDNVQLMCRRCNYLKSDHLSEEMNI